ncbi:MAG TPA: aminotransferase class I/II-fold pyridoxal phosphate-dependent enzyme [Patescibacteria group bacterium]
MRPIALGLSPNTQSDDIALALRQIVMPWNYTKGTAVAELERWFKQYFQTEAAITFTNARSGLYAILSNLGIGKGDEVIVQAFTCVVVPNPILATGAKVIYVDVTKNLSIDTKDLEKKISKKTKAIIVQHTFAMPAEIEKIIKIAKAYGIYVIEDVAHSIGAEYKNKKLGTFGIASIFSLGRDKAFSSVFGGVVITKDRNLAQKLKVFQRQKPYPKPFWIFQQLLHPLAFSIILPLYDTLRLGKIILVILQKLHLLSFPVESAEKRGKFYPSSIRKYPNALAVLALHQLKKVASYNHKRKVITNQYLKITDELHMNTPAKKDEVLLRFPIFIEKPFAARQYFKQFSIYLGDWYANVIDPRDTNFSAVGYVRGSCPQAEYLARRIVNLPTYPAMEDNDINKVIEVLRSYAAS